MIIQIKMDVNCNYAIMKYFKLYFAVIILVNKSKLKKIFELPPISIPSVFEYVPRVSRACTCAK